MCTCRTRLLVILQSVLPIWEGGNLRPQAAEKVGYAAEAVVGKGFPWPVGNEMGISFEPTSRPKAGANGVETLVSVRASPPQEAKASTPAQARLQPLSRLAALFFGVRKPCLRLLSTKPCFVVRTRP